jgi:hypothetical protein
MNPSLFLKRSTLVVLLTIMTLSTNSPALSQTSQPYEEQPALIQSSQPEGQVFQVIAAPDQPDSAVGSSNAPAPNAPLAGVDDRDNSDPTSWAIYARQSASDVMNIISTGLRPVDIKIDQVSPSYRFTVAYVSNTGSYARSFWWFYGMDEATLNSNLAANNGRLISLKAVDIGSGQIRFTGVFIPNSGTDAVVWWWYYNQTVPQITTLFQQNNARLTQVTSYQTGGQTRYAVVMVSNTGDFARSWWWYVNATPANIVAYSSANNARLIDLDHDPASGNYNVIMTSCASGCPMWWWWVGIDENALINLANQYGARIIDVNSYPGCSSGTCYDMIFINNSNEITSRVGEMLRSHTDGTVGLFLKQVNESVLANLMDSTPFEPASTIKSIVHLYTMQQLQSGPETLATQINHYQPPASGSCPGNTIIGTEPIQIADQEMMWHSDNSRTRAVVDHYGVANINTMAGTLGMAHTSINHIIGCGVANGTLLAPTYRTLFFSQMAGKAEYNVEGYDWTRLWDTDIPNIINQEAPADMPAATRDAYRNMIELSYKAGNYKICGASCATSYVDHISIFGYAQIPFCDGGGPRQYVFGTYIYNATSDANSSNAFNLTKAELLREQIRAGLASCNHALFWKVYLPTVIQ